MSPETKRKRAEFNKLLGKRSANAESPRKPILFRNTEYPHRSRSIGHSSGSTEGVAGWRSSYYDINQVNKQ